MKNTQYPVNLRKKGVVRRMRSAVRRVRLMMLRVNGRRIGNGGVIRGNGVMHSGNGGVIGWDCGERWKMERETDGGSDSRVRSQWPPLSLTGAFLRRLGFNERRPAGNRAEIWPLRQPRTFCAVLKSKRWQRRMLSVTEYATA